MPGTVTVHVAWILQVSTASESGARLDSWVISLVLKQVDTYDGTHLDTLAPSWHR